MRIKTKDQILHTQIPCHFKAKKYCCGCLDIIYAYERQQEIKIKCNECGKEARLWG